MIIKENVIKLQNIIKNYPSSSFVVSSKYMTNNDIKQLKELEVYEYGENKVDSLISKYDSFSSDKRIKWHFIGTLQTNKVKHVVDKIICLHSLDRYNLAVELNKRLNSPLDCYVQVNINNEATKHGLKYNEVIDFIRKVKQLPKINVVGIMCIGSLNSDANVICSEFKLMNDLKGMIEDTFDDLNIKLSMGMSNDYELALEYGANIVRIGRILIGEKYD